MRAVDSSRRTLGKPTPVRCGERRGDALDVVGLAAEVELLQHHGADLAIEPLHALVRDEPRDDAEDAAQRAQIDGDDLLDVGILHLDRDLLARRQARAVHLADRRRGDRPLVELGEQLARRLAELLAQALLDLGVGPRRHLVLQPLELGAELLGQKVRHDRDELPDLDEQPLQPRDRAVHAARVAADVSCAPARRSPPASGSAPARLQRQIRQDDARGRPVGGPVAQPRRAADDRTPPA